MHSNWSIRADAPGDRFYVVISVQHPTPGGLFHCSFGCQIGWTDK